MPLCFDLHSPTLPACLGAASTQTLSLFHSTSLLARTVFQALRTGVVVSPHHLYPVAVLFWFCIAFCFHGQAAVQEEYRSAARASHDNLRSWSSSSIGHCIGHCSGAAQGTESPRKTYKMPPPGIFSSSPPLQASLILMRIPFISPSTKQLSRRKGGGGGGHGGGHSGGGHSGGAGESSGGHASSNTGHGVVGAPVSGSVGGKSRTSSAYGSGGGRVETIPSGQLFSGRTAGGGSRAQVFGTR